MVSLLERRQMNAAERTKMINPLIFETGGQGERAYDIFSKLLTQRVIFLGEEIDDVVANIICAQLNYLDSENDNPISLYINSPGGIVTACLAIYDTMQYIDAEVHTLCIGQACSAAALLLLAGTKGKRRALPNSTIMLHQPSGGVIGKATDIEIASAEIARKKRSLTEIVIKHTEMDREATKKALEFDWYMTAEEARDHGIIDTIITKKQRFSF